MGSFCSPPSEVAVPQAARIAAVVGGVIITDQLTKASAVWAAPHSDGAMRVIQNAGGTLPVAGIELPLMVLIAVAGLATFGRYAAVSALDGRTPAWVAGLLVGGALSNLADRLVLGSVTDFLATPWVVFNMADLAVVVGLFTFTLTSWSRRRSR
jgi:signal peptidase II